MTTPTPEPKVVNMVSATIAKLIDDPKFDTRKLVREIRGRFPKLTLEEFGAAFPELDERNERKLLVKEIGFAAGGNGQAPDYEALGRALGLFKDPVDLCRNRLPRFFPWVDWPWLAKQFAVSNGKTRRKFVYSRDDAKAWKQQRAYSKFKAAQFFEALEGLDEDLLFEFLEQVLAETRREKSPGMQPLVDRLAGVCAAMGLPRPPDDLDLVEMAESCL